MSVYAITSLDDAQAVTSLWQGLTAFSHLPMGDAAQADVASQDGTAAGAAFSVDGGRLAWLAGDPMGVSALLTYGVLDERCETITAMADYGEIIGRFFPVADAVRYTVHVIVPGTLTRRIEGLPEGVDIKRDGSKLAYGGDAFTEHLIDGQPTINMQLRHGDDVMGVARAVQVSAEESIVYGLRVEQKRQRFGSLLGQRLLQACFDAGAEQVMAILPEGNTAGQRLAARLGFKVTGAVYATQVVNM